MVRMTREEILAGEPQLERKEIVIKEWGGTFYVREWDGTERDGWERAIVGNRVNSRGITTVHSLYNEDGTRVFKDEDAEAVGKRSARILSRVCELSRKLNKFDADDLEIEKGKSEPDQVAPSTST